MPLATVAATLERDEGPRSCGSFSLGPPLLRRREARVETLWRSNCWVCGTVRDGEERRDSEGRHERHLFHPL